MSATHCPKCGQPYELNRGHTCVVQPKLAIVGSGNLPDLFRQACERIFDMLLADDGEAWSEAERFLKAHAPDLYNRIGMPKEKKDE